MGVHAAIAELYKTLKRLFIEAMRTKFLSCTRRMRNCSLPKLRW
jgi:hypothetical protein